jgi:hypothetical protein
VCACLLQDISERACLLSKILNVPSCVFQAAEASMQECAFPESGTTCSLKNLLRASTLLFTVPSRFHFFVGKD